MTDEERNDFIGVIQTLLRTGRGADIHYKEWFNGELEKLKVSSPDKPVPEQDTILKRLIALRRFTEDRLKKFIYYNEEKNEWFEDGHPQA